MGHHLSGVGLVLFVALLVDVSSTCQKPTGAADGTSGDNRAPKHAMVTKVVSRKAWPYIRTCRALQLTLHVHFPPIFLVFLVR